MKAPLKRSRLHLVMVAALIIVLVSVVIMIACILFFPKLCIGKFQMDTFFLAPLLGAILLLSLGLANPSTTLDAFISDKGMNPLKILALFLSMSFLSIVLDEAGLFRFLAEKSLSRSKGSQKKMFVLLYLLTSILTVFTSNDVIILTFTPFLIYFCKRAKIDPLPFLIEEFIAANTFSMVFLIGNPTNIYLASNSGVDFISYFQVMWLPSIMAGLIAFAILYLLFRRKLSTPMSAEKSSPVLEDPLLVYFGTAILAIVVVLLAVSSYIGFEMYLICVLAAAIYLAFALVYCALKKEGKRWLILTASLKRVPYTLIPFLLSMFVLVEALYENGVSFELAKMLSGATPYVSYLGSSLLFCNLINNIPMSVLFSSSIASFFETPSLPALYSSIIGSNIGAFLTPLGALAGIMWMGLLKKGEVKLSFLGFMKYGFLVGIPTAAAAGLGLYLSFLFLA